MKHVRGSFTQSPQKSTIKACRESNIPQQTDWKILQKRFKFHPYHLQFTQTLTPDDKAKRQSFCEEMQLRMETKGFIESLHLVTKPLSISKKKCTNTMTGYGLWKNPNSYVEHVCDSPKVNVFYAIKHEKMYGPFASRRQSRVIHT